MERTELAAEKGMERSVPIRAEDGSSSSMQMVAEAKMLEPETEKAVEVFAIAEKQGTIKGKESMRAGDGSSSSMEIVGEAEPEKVVKVFAPAEKQGTIKGKKSMRVDERDEELDSSSRVAEIQPGGCSRSVSKAEDRTSSSSWMQMVEEAKMLALGLRTIEESPAEPEEGSSSSSNEEHGSSILVVEMHRMHRIRIDMERWMRPSIYRVPDWLKSMTKADAYRPQVVSLGPFHHGEPSLGHMEEQKRRLVRHMVDRSRKPLSEFVKAITKVADKLQDAYCGLDVGWYGHNTARFVDVMVTDGGFLLEFMATVTGRRRSVLEAGYAPYDPIFSERSLLSLWARIRSDMMLVENQVPLLALQTLEAVRTGTFFQSDADDINKLVTDFICPNLEKIRNQKNLGLHTLQLFHRKFCSQPEELREEGLHFKKRLHQLETLRRKFCGGQDELGQSETTTLSAEGQSETTMLSVEGQSETTMLSAEDLREAGVHFKTSATPSVQDIDFKNGVLRMPLVEIDDNSERTFLNLMAFERLHSDAGNVATDYMIFMDNIIDSERDVALLRSKKVLKNFLGSDKEAADLFNTLGKGATLSPGSKVGHVQWLVSKHCERPWPKLQASFKHTYLRNPWVFFSAVAAIILLGLTILQTVYTVVPFYTKN